MSYNDPAELRDHLIVGVSQTLAAVPYSRILDNIGLTPFGMAHYCIALADAILEAGEEKAEQVNTNVEDLFDEPPFEQLIRHLDQHGWPRWENHKDFTAVAHDFVNQNQM